MNMPFLYKIDSLQLIFRHDRLALNLNILEISIINNAHTKNNINRILLFHRYIYS